MKNEIKVSNWFLNGKADVRSSYYLEDVVTEFDVQGLELDYTLVAWDGDFMFHGGAWEYRHFKGTKWTTVRNAEEREFLKNTYRVLLTRAREGMIIFVPQGSEWDGTRKKEYYDGTYTYLRSLGIPEVSSSSP